MKTTQTRPANLARKPLVAALALALAGTAVQVSAQESRRGSANVMLEEVVVTARKREEGSQDVPLQISAFGSDQLAAMKVRDLTNLAVGMPNVALDDIGTTRGTANFSIRGLGINSSIPGIDPTVGVFQDGVYLGINNGIIFDMFDVESIEVLRGPQGTLFGRNVTGGAVLINTKKPGEEFEATFRAAADMGDQGGLNSYIMGSVGGPLNDWAAAKVTVFHNDDEGWFENDFDGSDVGAIKQTMIRPILVLNPTDALEVTLRYEYVETDGDGPVPQSHTNGSGVPGSPVNSDRDSFDANYDEVGFQETRTNFFNARIDWDVGFGNGTVTNIFGLRDYTSEARSDIDAQPVWIFHAPAWLDTEQVSNELRYNGTFFDDRANVTVGGMYFKHEIQYHERRELLGVLTGGVAPGAQFDGGGLFDTESISLFAAVDYDLTDSLTLSAGVNYSREEKEVQITSLSFNSNPGCNIVTTKDCPFDFEDSETWDNFAPKLGLTYRMSDDAQVYGHWSRGIRSGGYNLRNTSFDPADIPGPFDEETVDNFELGYKSQWSWGRINAAVFYNQIADMQREINLPGPIGTIQLVRNTSDAEIMGLEVDGTFSLSDNLVAIASVGVIDAEYTDVFFDLNGDGSIDGGDEALDLPRAPEVTWTVGLNHDLDIGSWGYLSSRITYAYRDEMAFTDDNRGFILDQEILDLGFDLYSNSGKWVFSLYGRNLLNDVKHGGDTQLPNTIGPVPLGGTFSPLARGRVYGAEVTFNL